MNAPPGADVSTGGVFLPGNALCKPLGHHSCKHILSAGQHCHVELDGWTVETGDEFMLAASVAQVPKTPRTQADARAAGRMNTSGSLSSHMC